MDWKHHNLFSDLSKFPSLEVITISEMREKYSWEELSLKMPMLPKGWYELVGLSLSERLSVYGDYWMKRLQIQDKSRHGKGIQKFFSLLSDIDVFAYRSIPEAPYQLTMVYLILDGEDTFYGSPPIDPSIVHSLEHAFPVLGDSYYYNFFSIHNGFGKLDDGGIISLKDLAKQKYKLSELLHCYADHDALEHVSESLFPFYVGEGLHTFQCFILDPEIRRNDSSPNFFIDDNYLKNNLSSLDSFFIKNYEFKSFLSWLEHYLNKDE